MAGKMNDSNNDDIPRSLISMPIWHNPVWVTAIVGLVGAFLTIPEQVGNILINGQEVEKIRVQNIGLKQSQELSLVKETLGQLGTERIFLLRYLSETADDKDAKTWANKEVIRLETLAVKIGQKESIRQRAETIATQLENTNSKKLKDDFENSSAELRKINIEISRLQLEAGIKIELGRFDTLQEQQQALAKAAIICYDEVPLVKIPDVWAAARDLGIIPDSQFTKAAVNQLAKISNLATSDADKRASLYRYQGKKGPSEWYQGFLLTARTSEEMKKTLVRHVYQVCKEGA
jgi:hypothetical protein